MMAGQDRHSWQKAIAQSELPAGARHVALTVSVWTDPTGGQGVWLTGDELAHLTGLQKGTVRRHLRTLIVKGWLHNSDGARFLAFPGERGLTGRMTAAYPEDAWQSRTGAPPGATGAPL